MSAWHDVPDRVFRAPARRGSCAPFRETSRPGDCPANVFNSRSRKATPSSTVRLPFNTSVTGWLNSSFPSASPVYGVVP